MPFKKSSSHKLFDNSQKTRELIEKLTDYKLDAIISVEITVQEFQGKVKIGQINQKKNY